MAMALLVPAAGSIPQVNGIESSGLLRPYRYGFFSPLFLFSFHFLQFFFRQPEIEESVEVGLAGIYPGRIPEIGYLNYGGPHAALHLIAEHAVVGFGELAAVDPGIHISP